MYLIICAPIEFRCEVLQLGISEWSILAVSDPVSRGLEIQFLYCQTTDSVTPLKRGPPSPPSKTMRSILSDNQTNY